MKYIKCLRFIPLLALIITTISSCKKDNPDNPADDSSVEIEGMGTSKATPQGAPLSFPAGITVSSIKGFDIDCFPESQQDQTKRGSGSMVDLCLMFQNHTSQPLNIEIPPGTVFISNSTTYQNGLLIERIAITIPPGSYYVNIGAYCINADREIPDQSSAYVTQMIVSNNSLIKEFLGMLTGKSIDPDEESYLQDAIWDVTDNGKITQEAKDHLNHIN